MFGIGKCYGKATDRADAAIHSHFVMNE